MSALSTAEAVIGAIRDEIGDSADILIGTHGQMTPAAAIRFAKRVERFDPLWFEEPVPPENMAALAVVARATSIPITWPAACGQTVPDRVRSGCIGTSVRFRVPGRSAS